MYLLGDIVFGTNESAGRGYGSGCVMECNAKRNFVSLPRAFRKPRLSLMETFGRNAWSLSACFSSVHKVNAEAGCFIAKILCLFLPALVICDNMGYQKPQSGF